MSYTTRALLAPPHYMYSPIVGARNEHPDRLSYAKSTTSSTHRGTLVETRYPKPPTNCQEKARNVVLRCRLMLLHKMYLVFSSTRHCKAESSKTGPPSGQIMLPVCCFTNFTIETKLLNLSANPSDLVIASSKYNTQPRRELHPPAEKSNQQPQQYRVPLPGRSTTLFTRTVRRVV